MALKQTKNSDEIRVIYFDHDENVDLKFTKYKSTIFFFYKRYKFLVLGITLYYPYPLDLLKFK